MTEKKVYDTHSLRDSLWQAITRAPSDRIALQVLTDPESGSGGEKITYKELSDEIGKLSEEFRSKGLAGKRIGIVSERKTSVLIAVLACIVSECPAVLLDPNDEKDTIRKKLKRTDCCLLMGENGPEMIPDAQALAPEETFIILTSGTTGREKCVIRTSENVRLSSGYCAKSLHHGHVQILNLPLYHQAVWDLMLLPAFIKGCTVLLSRGPGNWMEEIRSARPEDLFVVPAQAVLLLSMLKDDTEGALSSLRYVISTGAALHADLVKRFASLGIECLDVYGSSEVGIIANPIYRDGKYETKPGSVGKLMPELEYRIDSPDRDGFGELLLKGPSVCHGYLKGEEEEKEEEKVKEKTAPPDGWFHTGDRARIDNDGFIYLNGRVKNLIILDSGENVSPEELEEVFGETEGIRECLCFEYENQIAMEIVPDEEWFVSHPGIGPEEYLTEKADMINGMLPSWKKVSLFYLRKKALERTLSGKIKRTGLPLPKEDGCISLIAPEPAADAKKDLSLEEAVLTAFRHAFPGRQIGPEDDFFDMGGDSLRAVQITAELDEMGYHASARDLLFYSGIREFAAFLKKKRGDDPLPLKEGIVAPEITEEELREIRAVFSKGTIEAVFPASGYEGINDLIMDKIIRHRMGFYFVDRILILKEPINEDEFRGRIKKISKRHPLLRSRFIKTSGGWRQVILKEISIPAYYTDWSSRDGDAALKLQNAVAEYRARYEKKAKEPLPELLRLYCCRLTEKQSVIFFELSHLGTDWLSEKILTKELLDGPKKDSEDNYLRCRVWQSRTDEKKNEQALRFWDDFEKTVYREKIRSIFPEGRELFPMKAFTIRLDEEELSAVKKYSGSNRATPAETITFIFLRALMEVYGRESLLFKERFDGRKSMPFDSADTVGDFLSDGICFLRKTDTLRDYHERLALIAVHSGSSSPLQKRKLWKVPLLVNKLLGDGMLPDNCKSIMSLRNTDLFPLSGEGIRAYEPEFRGKAFVIRIKYTGSDAFTKKLERISVCMKQMLAELSEGGA